MKQAIKQPLTDLLLRKLKSGEERIEVWDAKLPGFGVRVSPAGTKSSVLLYRFRGLPQRLTLGRYPVLGLGEARELAKEALNQVMRGDRPQAGGRGTSGHLPFRQRRRRIRAHALYAAQSREDAHYRLASSSTISLANGSAGMSAISDAGTSWMCSTPLSSEALPVVANHALPPSASAPIGRRTRRHRELSLQRDEEAGNGRSTRARPLG